jgi:hypothetical protein
VSRQQRVTYLLEFIFDGFEIGLVSLDEAAVLVCNEAQQGGKLKIAEGLYGLGYIGIIIHRCH